MIAVNEYIQDGNLLSPCFICGDALHVLTKIPENSIDCVVTSPPYYMKRQYLIIQKPLYEHMKSDFNFDGIKGVRLGDPIHIHSYDFVKDKNKLGLSLDVRVSTDSVGIANCLDLNAESKVELQDLIKILEPKLIETNRLKIGINI